jgi:ketosteroid isomerase-like protein
MNSIEANKNTVTRFFDSLNAGDTQAIVDAYADEGCVETKGSTLISGVFDKEQIAASAGAIFEVFPKGLSFEITGMVAEGEKVAVEATSRGEHISGKIYGNEYHFLFEFRDGKLLWLKEYMDTEQVTDVLCAGQRPPFGG